ncbi:MAG: EFR1 family ferrodoxin [Defluviitaleaceae bacterium]|nr:EFR1 family ferrodoxin [Defluviitaleaceae bacterium]
MKKILILYFSGVGATKKIAELISACLPQSCKVDIFSLEDSDVPSMEEYDALIIGTPVYHGAPAKKVMDFLDEMPCLDKEISAFVFNTRGLASLNTNRILSKRLREKNIATIMDRAYRGTASDGALVAPFIKRFFEFEKNLEDKVKRDCADFLRMLEEEPLRSYMPKFRFGSIINAPNKAAGQLITVKIHLHKDRCVKCGLCGERCPHAVFLKDGEGYPLLAQDKCENCYRCIHHCPKSALSLSKRRLPKKQLRL